MFLYGVKLRVKEQNILNITLILDIINGTGLLSNLKYKIKILL